MSRVVHIAATQKAVFALCADGTIWRYGKEWEPIPAIPSPTGRKASILDKLKPQPMLLARTGIMGNSYFTGTTWTPNPDLAQQFTEREIEQQTSAVPGTVAVPLNVAQEEIQRIVGPRKRKKKK